MDDESQYGERLQAVVILGGTGGLGQHLVDLWLRNSPRTPVVRVGSEPRAVAPDHPWRLDLSWNASKQSLRSSSLWNVFDGSLGLYPRLVINAIGINEVRLTEQLVQADLHRFVDVNVWPTVAMAQALVLAPTHSVVGQERPTLVSVGSSACDGAGARSLAYVTSKHALTGVTRSLARDFKGRINVLQINPPKLEGVDSRMSQMLDAENASLRMSSLQEEKARQAASSPSGQGYPTTRAVAEWIYGLLRDFEGHQHLHGSVVRIGYGS